MHSLLVLGRQPALGLAELESLYGTTVTRVSGNVAGVDLDPAEIDFWRLGGSTKLARVLGETESGDWPKIEKSLIALARTDALTLPASGKFHLGLSVIGFDISPAKLNALGLTLKKTLRSRSSGSIRIVPNQTTELSTAQVYHNHLAAENGAELLIAKTSDGRAVVARTVAVQDIDSYTLRDRGRPRRDARVGMLPPKLAQIIINLATGPKHPSSEIAILDPFCGTGVILQEALLSGFTVYGTDLEPRMVDYTSANLKWLGTQYSLRGQVGQIRSGDATSFQWEEGSTLSAVACETYLGRPFTTVPNHELLEQTVSEVNTILKKFLINIHTQLTPGTHLCVAVPAWQISPSSFRHLPLIDSLSELGFARVQFAQAKSSDLLYYREGQIVARELLVMSTV